MSCPSPAPFGSLRWRNIGPFRGGRVVAVAGHPRDPLTFYFGSTGGGVWGTKNGGTTWQNLSDGFLSTSSVGALAVAESDPNILFAGMGECSIRGNVTRGDGVYKSTDGGRTWAHVGLKETRHIARVRIHPHNPDVVYVAALGHAFGPNDERGVFRSTDGGRTWRRILYRSERAGAIDLSLDPTNPRILYAAMWEAQRTPHSLTSGGPGSGLFKSTDGGDTWTELTRNPGLPQNGVIGKIGVAVSPAKPDRVYAIVEALDGGVFRSEDGGLTWRRTSDDRNLRSRAWYYSHIFADPQNPDTVWVLNMQLWKSVDGGVTFKSVATPHVDNHDLWLDPANPERMIEGNDGGACVSFDGGASWSTIYNQPTGEFYHVTTDDRFPYRVYGAQQDNSTLSGPSRTRGAAILMRDWYDVGGGESGYIAVRHDNGVIFAGSYGGTITRYDREHEQLRDVTVWPHLSKGQAAKDLDYRWNWTSPLVLSPHDPNVLYSAANVLFRSLDEGASWEVISPDLTRHDPATLAPSGGPITKDHTGAEVYATIFAFAESPLKRGLFWAGSDDGLIHLSRDGGAHWENVTPPDLPEWSLISIIEPSRHDPAVAYVAATRYKLDDFAPYLYVTRDYGATWTRIVSGIAADDFTRVIREDAARPGLLYAGTETGVYVSLDGGGNWQRLQLNLPVVPVHDLAVKDGDLVAATHGRGFWILDEVSLLRQLGEAQSVALYAPRPTVRLRGTGRIREAKNAVEQPVRIIGLTTESAYMVADSGKGGEAPVFVDAGQNPPGGVVIHYWLNEAGPVTLTIRDAAGAVIKTFSSEKAEDGVAATAGANRFVWDMLYPDAVQVPGLFFYGRSAAAPLAIPGHYSVELTAAGQTLKQEFEIRKDPASPASQEDYVAQFRLLVAIRDKVSEAHEAVNRLRRVREQIGFWEARLAERAASREAAGGEGAAGREALAPLIAGVRGKLEEIEANLVEVRIKAPQDGLNFPPQVNNKLTMLFGFVANADAAPTKQAREVFALLAAQVDAQVAKLREVLDADVRMLSEAIGELGLPALGA